MSLPTNSPMTRVPDDYCPPGGARHFTLGEGPDAGKTLFYYDVTVGEGTPRTTVLMVHGNPECSYTYRHVRDHLIASGTPCRIVAMDHIGFGRSDQASFEMVDMHHAANLKQLVAHLDLHDIALLVHDWGGGIGIGALIDSPERVTHLVVMNSTVFPMPDQGFVYTNYPYPMLPWYRTADLVPAHLWGAVSAYVVSHAAPQSLPRFTAGIAGMVARYYSGRLTRDMDTPESVWCAQFGTRINALSSQRNVRHTPYWGHGYRYTVPGLGTQDTGPFYRHIQSRIGAAWGQRVSASALPVISAAGMPAARMKWLPNGTPRCRRWRPARIAIPTSGISSRSTRASRSPRACGRCSVERAAVKARPLA